MIAAVCDECGVWCGGGMEGVVGGGVAKCYKLLKVGSKVKYGVRWQC